ncbi:MAG TPA: ABC transporter permease [Thermomicrobiales bacterium]
MRPLLVMIKANLKMAVRNRAALFWNLVFPALFIIIFGVVFGGNEGINITVGITGESPALRDATVQAMEQTDAITVKTGPVESELQALRDGDRDVVIVFGSQPEQGQPPVELYYDETDGPNAQVAVGVVRQILLTVAQEEDPLQIAQTPVAGEDISFIDFFVPGVLAMALMNSGVIGLSTAFVAYRERGILRRIKVTPFPLTSFITARVVSQVIVAVAQALILVGLAKVLFGLKIRGNLLLILIAILIGALAFLAIGFAIAAVSRNVEVAASYSNLITFPMLFLSGVFFSLDSAPAWLRPISKVLPLSYLVDALREPMTRGQGLDAIWLDLLILLATLVVCLAVAVRFFRWEARSS